ncbi:MAG: tetratricopeptide repeat protein [Gemmatimonadetes bacterium]|nr:tetratricopeptide repeat protein [Gemmatimonadota bacterium]
MSRRRMVPLLFTAAALAACETRPGSEAAPSYEAVSLLGDTLVAPTLSDSLRAARERQLADAEAAYARDSSADALIWVGRRTAYLGRYRDAVEVFAAGATRFPEDARFYRHRGHRYITLRRLDLAVQDLDRAAQLIAGRPDEVEPDGLPNARNTPTSTLQSNIWYHLGLAYYLKGDFPNALRAYQECLQVSKNPDMLVATSNWLYLTLRRLNRTTEAARVLTPIRRDMDIIENGSYHRMLLMYQGVVPPDSVLRLSPAGEPSLEDVTAAYGVGAWHLVNGRQTEAERVFHAVVEAKGQWAAFGYLAAEAELARPSGRSGPGRAGTP